MRYLWIGLVFVASMFGCGGGEGEGDDLLCVPGESVACIGAGGCSGGQACLPDGSGFSACECAPEEDMGPGDLGAGDMGPGDLGPGDMGPGDLGPEPEDMALDMSPPPRPLDCTGADARCLFVASTLSVAVEDVAGAVPGFDLDGRISDATDDLGCNQEDWVSPDGVPGIDNQFASLAPTLEAALGEDLQDAIDASIADGSLILLMELEGVDATNDDTVTLDVASGSTADGDPPTLDGTAIAPGQSFTIDLTPVDDAPAVLRGGVLEASAPELPFSLPIDATTNLDVIIRDAQVRATVTGVPTLEDGVIGGWLMLDELVTAFQAAAPDVDSALIRSVLEGVADLEPDGDGICQAVSIAVTFEGVEANEG